MHGTNMIWNYLGKIKFEPGPVLHNLGLGAIDASNDLHWEHSILSLNVACLVHDGFEMWMLVKDHLHQGLNHKLCNRY